MRSSDETVQKLPNIAENRKRTQTAADRPYPISPNVPTADSHQLLRRSTPRCGGSFRRVGGRRVRRSNPRSEHPAVRRPDGRSANQISDRVLVAAGSFVLTRRMSGKFGGTRSEITGPAGVEFRAVELPSGGKRTACVSMPLSPAGTNFQQLLIGRRSFTPSSAIAEYPGADVGYFFFLW